MSARTSPRPCPRAVVVAVESVERRVLFAANFTPNEALVARTYHVNAATGSDTNGNDGLSAAAAFASVRKGLEAARDSGVNVKVSIADGTYTDAGGEISFDYGPNKSQVLVIEGQSRDGVRVTSTSAASGGYLYFGPDRQNVVMRNLTFRDMPKSVFGAGRWDVISNSRYWVIDNCAFVGNATADPAAIAVSLQTVRDLTIKNCRFADNFGQAIELTTRDATIVDTVFTNNNRNWDAITNDRLKQDRNATVGFSGLDVDVTRVTVEGSRYIGWRNDHVAERVTLDGCTFRNNVIGTTWEIAYGPLTIKNTTIENNARGVQLETTNDTTLDNVTFRDNTDGAVYLTWKPRTLLRGDPNTYDSGGAGDLSRPVGSQWTYEKPMNGTRRTTIRNSTFSTTKGANSLFYRKRPEDTSPGEYRSWYADELTATNNSYYNNVTTAAFEVTNAAGNGLVTTDFAGWQAATGSDTAPSRWAAPTTTPTPRTPENPANTVAGLDRRYYTGTWTVLPNFDALTPARTDTSTGFGITPNSGDNFGYAFTGYVDVPADGTYTFYTNSDDGSKLYIGTAQVVDNDGLHGNVERSGTVALRAGKHAVRVTFFENGGGETLGVSWSGPSLAKQAIPDARLHRANGSNPTAPVGPAGYAYVANEGQSYTFAGTVDVAYGANGSFAYLAGVTGTVTFNNATFGDPAPGVAKYGFYRTPTGPTPADLVGNGGFESGAMGAWTTWGGGSVANNNARSGAWAGRIASGAQGALEQVITGLKANTTYTVRGHAKAGAGGTTVYLGAKDFGGAEVSRNTAGTAYAEMSFAFTTGAANTSVKVYVYTPNTGGAYADDISVTEGPTTAALTNRATGGTATASSSPVAAEGPAQGFDGNAGTKWLGTWSTTSAVWLQYQFGSSAAHTVAQYTITSANDGPTRDPRSWVLEGSNDGAGWAAVDTRSDQSFGGRGVTNAYAVATPGSYRYYRLRITANGGDGLVQLADLRLLA